MNTKTSANPKAIPEDSQLVKDLLALSKSATKRRALVKSSTYDAPSDPEIKVRSWKMDEFKYYDVPSPFPSLVRGLFTVDLPGNEADFRIVARGYDKFFNIGEVPWTTWAALEDHTTAPYTLSLKSNGCIIFIGALTPSKIVVTSKHSLGKTAGDKPSHAEVGERWLRKYFADKGRTEADFAKVLWDNNWTAVAELCDDSFEEHVLATAPELTGLHLHGINACTKAFKTMPHDLIDSFAEEWGFIKTLSTTLNTIAEVRSFTQEVGEIGHWNGQAVEGFVVRTHVASPSAGKSSSKSPYSPGSTFFFKVKFDEPYMMYRDWREVTKKLLGQQGPLIPSSLPKSKMQRPETKAYVKWVIEEIKRDRGQFKHYNEGQGIIATRERFLEWQKTQDIDCALDFSYSRPCFGKTIIVPVAIPGCGKTTVAVALANIFGWGHTQSDDVRAKKPAPVFIKNVHNLLKHKDVVIADKNNHLTMHRKSLRELSIQFTPPARLLALNWSCALSTKSPAEVHAICGERVLTRGDKHQSLTADEENKSHEQVIWQFINNTEELGESEVDACIDMQLEDTLEEAVARAVEGCVEIKIAQGIQVALGYAPKTTKPKETPAQAAAAAKPKTDKIRYFGLAPEASKRVATQPHVTIVHQKGLPADQPLWDRCMELHRLAQAAPQFEITLGNVVWNDRIMAATVDDLKLVGAGDEGQKGAQFIAQLPEEVRNRLHITVGTGDAKVLPVEAKTMVENWRRGKTDGVKVKALSGVVVSGRVKGLIA
ncbi:hypothetical protein BDZ89DRAFT_1100303 [Hymenopellis radicata]|nr:hypothetical protein BDZ89DRAFT_1100303 [Hymenopellis radicata]